MLDERLQSILSVPLDLIGRRLAGLGVHANAVTLMGAIAGIGASVAIGGGRHGLALALIAICRTLDGLDGAVARASRRSDWGGYLDIIADYVFYVGVPLGFAIAAPATNALPAAALLASFVLTSASFLAFAALAAKRADSYEILRQKSFFYSHGLMEGGETIAFFVAMTLWPTRFPALAWIFSILCLLTVLQRSLIAMRQFHS